MKFIAAFLCLFIGALCAQDEKPIRIFGVLSLEVFPGRPNYDSVKDGDQPEKAWILTVVGERKETFQLVVADGSEQTFATLRRCEGKKVWVDGLVWSAGTGHHHIPFMISIRSIEEEADQPSQPTGKS